MIIPDYWAEASRPHRQDGRPITIRRFGWSTTSQAEAQAMAETRAAEAVTRIVAGEHLERREPKTAYNGAHGLPIREEVLSRHGDEVITRNAYGAHCLNSPRALFADVDFPEPQAAALKLASLAFFLAVISGVVALHYQSWTILFVLLVISAILALGKAALFPKPQANQGSPDQLARERIQKFLSAHPDWSLRLYQTPGGLRLLATHQPFDPSSPEVQEFFAAIGADPVYVRMCTNQKCFRAWLTGKPWRMGISSHLRPQPGVWPVHPDRLPLRLQWVEHYESLAPGFAACRFLESLGPRPVHDDLREVIALHDRLSRATQTELPLA